MKNRYINVLIPFLSSLFAGAITIDGQSNADNNTSPTVKEKQTSCLKILFRINEVEIDPSYMDNREQLRKLHETFSEIFSEENTLLDNIEIKAAASPDGRLSFNIDLANNRANNLKQYILKEFPKINPSQIIISSLVEDWSNLSPIVEKDNKIPSKDQVLSIINSQNKNEEKSKRLKRLDGGKPYAYIAKQMLPNLRYGSQCTLWYKLISETKPIADEPETKEETHTVFPVEKEVIPNITPETKSKQFAIKTNMAYLAATVANIGVEFPLGEHFSIDVPFMYSPYMISRKYRIEVLALQPELRYWFNNQPLKGHFVGLHGHVGWYTVSFNSKRRFQDKDGDTPLWGGGLSYGYAHSLSKRWGLEFTVGAGYAKLEYDTFHNYHNGQKYDTNTKNYWGITRIGINLIYKINLK